MTANERAARIITSRVLEEVAGERVRQRARYGSNDDLQDGTGTAWLKGTDPQIERCTAGEIEAAFRQEYEWQEYLTGKPTWMHLVREEVAEAFAETDVPRLREELLQVAALCVSWVETLDARAVQP